MVRAEEHKVDLEWLKEMCPNAPVVLSRYAPVDIWDCKNLISMDISEIRGKPVYGFCGIAEPDHFKETLLACGAELVGFESFRDHHNFRGREVQDLEKRATEAGAAMLITTEKDSVRLISSRIRGLPILALRVEMKVLEGEEKMWERIGEVLHVG